MSAGVPDISVVIPFYNRLSEVETCLRSVLAQQLNDGRVFEVVAVDNGSTDGTWEALQAFAGIRAVQCLRRGPGAARNAGVGQARAPVVAFLDSDCIAEPGWLQSLTVPFADPEVLFTGGCIRSLRIVTGPEIYADTCQILDNAKFLRGHICFPPFFATANAAFRRKVFETAGGFDEMLMVGEDADLCWRTLDLGGSMVYCPEAVVFHRHRDTLEGFFRQALAYGEGSVQVFRKHRERLGVQRRVTWENVRTLARLLIEIPARLVLCRTSWKRRSAIYDAIWRTGFTLGCLKGSWRYRVLYLG